MNLKIIDFETFARRCSERRRFFKNRERKKSMGGCELLFKKHADTPMMELQCMRSKCSEWKKLETYK